jgi:uncharacterized protein (TIGR04222 family)
MSNWLLNIPGPYFLLFFSLVSMGLAAFCWYFFDGSSKNYALPDINKIDPLTFAVLRDGWRVAIDVTVIQLLERKIIGTKQIDGKEMLYIRTETADLSNLEAIVYDYLKVPKSPSYFKGAKIKETVYTCLQPVYRELEKLQLLKNKSQLRLQMWIAVIIIMGLEFLAAAKFQLGIMQHKPVEILVPTMLLAPFIMWKIIRPAQMKTKLGKKYINAVTVHFNWLKDKLASHSAGLDYAFGVALFGIGILPVSGVLGSYRAFAQSGLAARISSGADGGFSLGGGSSDGGSSGGGGCCGCGGGS